MGGWVGGLCICVDVGGGWVGCLFHQTLLFLPSICPVALPLPVFTSLLAFSVVGETCGEGTHGAVKAYSSWKWKKKRLMGRQRYLAAGWLEEEQEEEEEEEEEDSLCVYRHVVCVCVCG